MDSSEGSDVLDFTNFQADDYAAPDLSNDDPQEISADVLTIDLEGDSLPTIETVNDPADIIARVNGLVVDSQSDPGNITLFTFTAVEFGGSGVDSVNFYLDSNDNGVWDGGDTLLGTDSDGSDGWSTTVGASTIPSGQHKYFATAVGTISGEGPAEETPPIENGGGIGGGGGGGLPGGPGGPGGPGPGGPGSPGGARPLPVLTSIESGVTAGVTSPVATLVLAGLNANNATPNAAGAGANLAFAVDAAVVSASSGLDYANGTFDGNATTAITGSGQQGLGLNGLSIGSATATATTVASAYARVDPGTTMNSTVEVDSTTVNGQTLPPGTTVILNVYATVLGAGIVSDTSQGDYQITAGVGIAGAFNIGTFLPQATLPGTTTWGGIPGLDSGSVAFSPLTGGGITVNFELEVTVGTTFAVGGGTGAIIQAWAAGGAMGSAAAGALSYMQITVTGYY